MNFSGKNFARGTILFIAGAICASLVAVAVASTLSTGNSRVTSSDKGTPTEGLRPTGVGLPVIGAEGTVGAGDLTDTITAYHDDGQYENDLAAVGKRAYSYTAKRAKQVRNAAAKRCRTARKKGLKGPKLTNACKKPRLGIVFDIDETALSNYADIKALSPDFSQPSLGLGQSITSADSPAVAPSLKLYKWAVANRVSVHFITGRPNIGIFKELTEDNLKAVGYTTWSSLILSTVGSGLTTVPYKSGERAKIEKSGVDLIANIGDQESDLDGGHADRAFKYPNPYYFIGG